MQDNINEIKGLYFICFLCKFIRGEGVDRVVGRVVISLSYTTSNSACSYNFTHSGTFDTYTIGPVQPEAHLLSGPFLSSDEELKPDMYLEERSRVLELRRLRRIDDYVHRTFTLRTKKVSFSRPQNRGLKSDVCREL